MDNQHRKISGYRELDQDEIDRINRIKAKGQELQAIIDELAQADTLVRAANPGMSVNDSNALQDAARWRAIAKTHLQEGLMALTRSVAKPEFF